MWLKFLIISIFGCSCTLTTSFDIGGVMSGNSMAGVPLGHSLGDGELDVEGICVKSGMACQNCTHAITCVPLPMGWLKMPLQQCSDGETCNAHLGKCSTQAVPECEPASQKYQHSCEQVGIFPDAYDCRKFHLCSPAEGVPDGQRADHRSAMCPRNYGYNPQIAQCSIKLQNGQCRDKPVPDCSETGQSGVLPASVNHYYICLNKFGNLYPQVFVCPHGWYFWGYCRPDPPTIVETATTVKSTTLEPTTVKSTTLKPTTTRIEAFFSTDKPVTNSPDTFLADKFDLTAYESTDDASPSSSEFSSSLESDFW